MVITGKHSASGNTSGGPVRHGADSVATSAHGAIQSAANAAPEAIDRIAASAHGAVDKAASVAGRAADALDSKGNQLKETHARLVSGLGGYVRENPLTSLGIATAAGFVISYLVRSR